MNNAGQQLGNIAKSTASGAAAGSVIGPWGTAIGAAAGFVVGGIQAGIGTKKYKEGLKQQKAIQLQDQQTQVYLDTVRRKRIGADAGTGTRSALLKGMIEQSLSEQMSGITKFGGSGGGTLASYAYANRNTGGIMNQMLAGIAAESGGLLSAELDLNKQLVNRELQLRLLRASTDMGKGAELQNAGVSNILGGAGFAFGGEGIGGGGVQGKSGSFGGGAVDEDAGFDLEGRARNRSYGGGGGFTF